MAVQNAEVARAFDQIADLLEIDEANPFRVRAYRNAAQTIRSLPKSVADLVAEGADLAKLPGIGKDLAGKIAELVETGRLRALDELEGRLGADLSGLLALPGLGPKRVRLLHDRLGVATMADLAKAVASGRLRTLPGFGAKTEAAISAALERTTGAARRTLWIDAEPVARAIVAHMKGLRGVRQVEVAGSFRRRRETLGDLDVLVAATDGKRVVQHFVDFEDVARATARGSTRATVVLRSGLQVDLRVVEPASYGAALHYFTGSKAHNVAIRTLGVKRGLKVNEYGVFRGRRRIAGTTEAEVYRTFRLRYVEPELRENRGEIEAARRGMLPRLIEEKDVRGDLHVHTNASDGRATLDEMARAARARGYAYLAITEHTRAARIAHGLDARAMRRRLAAVERANASIRGLRLLKGAEVDILEDGTLDLPAEVLADLDVAVCAVHSHFGLSRARQTERILRAMDDPHFHVLAHPTGRLLGRREPYDVDLERLIEGAAERGCVLELNAQPLRMDLPDVWVRAAKDAGVPIAISTDAHATGQLDYMRVGVGYARRGWLERGDVVNARPWAGVAKLLRR